MAKFFETVSQMVNQFVHDVAHASGHDWRVIAAVAGLVFILGTIVYVLNKPEFFYGEEQEVDGYRVTVALGKVVKVEKMEGSDYNV